MPQEALVMARRLSRASTLTLLALLIAGCAAGPRRGALGEDVKVGTFTYRVLAAQWQDQIGRGERAAAPDTRFYVVYLTVTNNGAEPLPFPRARLVDAAGREYEESPKARQRGIGLGSLQTMSPGFTINSSLVFDVPPGAYTLILSNGNKGEASFTLPH
jgi:hypothetical protein